MGRVVVIGVGNPYRRDDGVGAAVIELLRRSGLPDEVGLECSLGDTAELIDLWRDKDLAIVVDAARCNSTAAPGIESLRDRSQPRPKARLRLNGVKNNSTAARLRLNGVEYFSSHHLPMGEAIELARALRRMPKRLELFAIEVADTGHGEGLSPRVRAAAQQTAEVIATEVKRLCALPIQPE